MENVYIPAFFSSYPNNLNFNEQLRSLKTTENFIDWNINEIKKEEKIVYESLIDKAIQFMKNIVNDGIKYISDLWKKFINKLRVAIKKINKIFKRYNNGNNIVLTNRNLKALFAFSNRGRVQSFITVDRLYTAYQKSLSLICGEIDRIYRSNIDLLNKLKDHQKSYKKVSESFVMEKVAYYDQLIHRFEEPDTLNNLANDDTLIHRYTESPTNAVFQALSILDQVFLENVLSLNIDNLEELIAANIDSLKLYDALSSSGEYLYDYLSKNHSLYEKYKDYGINNIALNDLYNAISVYSKEEFSDFFSDHIYTHYYPKDDIGKDRLVNYINILIAKNKAIEECLKNLIKIDFAQFKVNHIDKLNLGIKSDIEYMVTIYSDELRYIINNHKSNKGKTLILDFTDIGYGTIYISKSGLPILEKLLDLEYSTSLIYYITQFDCTIMTHGNTEMYGLAVYYNKLTYIEKYIFSKIYGDTIKEYEKIIGKSIDECDGADDNRFNNEFKKSFIQYRFTPRKLESIKSIPDENGLKFSDIEKVKLKKLLRWRTDDYAPINIPYSYEEYYDIELMVFALLATKKYKNINIISCNKDGFVLNKALINNKNFNITMPTRSVIK